VKPPWWDVAAFRDHGVRNGEAPPGGKAGPAWGEPGNRDMAGVEARASSEGRNAPGRTATEWNGGEGDERDKKAPWPTCAEDQADMSWPAVTPGARSGRDAGLCSRRPWGAPPGSR
jgi:hypothetical protein